MIINHSILQHIDHYRRIIENADILQENEFKYIEISETNLNYTALADRYGGSENILQVNDLPGFKKGESFFVKFNEYDIEESILKPEFQRIRVIYYNLDLTGIVEQDLASAIFNLELPYEDPNRPNPVVEKIRYVHFFNCFLKNISEENLFSGFTNDFRHECYYVGCTFDTLTIKGTRLPDYSSFIKHSNIREVMHSASSNIEFKFDGNNIDFLQTTSTKINLTNLNLKLLNIKILEGMDIQTKNVVITFDNTLLNKIKKDIIKLYPECLNTFYRLRELKSMMNNRMVIDKYINYFESRKNLIKQFLFCLTPAIPRSKSP